MSLVDYNKNTGLYRYRDHSLSFTEVNKLKEFDQYKGMSNEDIVIKFLAPQYKQKDNLTMKCRRIGF